MSAKTSAVVSNFRNAHQLRGKAEYYLAFGAFLATGLAVFFSPDVFFGAADPGAVVVSVMIEVSDFIAGVSQCRVTILM
jgi:hypothetical protein